MEPVKIREQLKDAGFTESQAGTLALILSSLATREDLEHLRREVREGFQAVDRKFEAVDKKFEAMESKFDAIDKKFDAVDKKFEGIYERFERVYEKFDAVNEKFAIVHRDIGSFWWKIAMLLTAQAAAIISVIKLT